MFVVSVVLALFLLYFYYMTRQGAITTHVKPTTPYTPTQPTFTQAFQESGNTFKYLVNGVVAWESTLSNSFRLDQGKMATRDVCFGQPDGSKHLATGQELYKNIQNYQLVQDAPQFEFDAINTAQDKRVFYFTCQNSSIHQVRMCPPGHVFKHQACQPIDMCHGRSDGLLFANRFDVHSYFQCRDETAVRQTCPKDHVFLFDHCANSKDTALYCQFHTQPKILDAQTLLVCRNNKVTYELCPPGSRYFDKPLCESNACEGQRDDSVIPLPSVERGPFSYSPGYIQCHHQKIKEVTYCPVEWDSHQSLGENLTHLPQVFDGKKCSIPSLCHNVTPLDPDTIVPAHEFSKHVQNWKYSKLYDNFTGYQCVKGVKKRVNLDRGFHISKRFKSEKACDGTRSKVPFSTRPDFYFDCTQNRLKSCYPNHYFNGEKCVPRIPNAFSFNGIDFFTLTNLRVDNWMPPWDYNKKPLATPCTAPESVWVELYNLCSHPDCTPYPFLSQIAYPLKLRDGSQCEFRERDRRLIKTPPSDVLYSYWSQRKKTQAPDVCIPGQRIQTGHFVWDSTIYMTCDEQHPFVFCPSSKTVGIDPNNMYACLPEGMEGVIPPHTKVEFARNEVKCIHPLDPTANVLIDHQDVVIPQMGYVPPEGFTLETVLQGVKIVYKHRVTYPPNVHVLENQTLKSYARDAGYLMKGNGSTRKPLEFPKYEVKQTIDEFVLDN